MVDNEDSSHEALAEKPHTMVVSVVWSRVVQSPQAADNGNGEESGAGLATVVKSPVRASLDDKARIRGEQALATVAMLVAVSGLYCEDHDSIIAWRNLGICCRRMTGSSPGARTLPTLSQQGWWLRRWWTKVSVAEARAAHDRLLQGTLGLEQRTAEERLEAWRGLILAQRIAGDPGKKN